MDPFILWFDMYIRPSSNGNSSYKVCALVTQLLPLLYISTPILFYGTRAEIFQTLVLFGQDLLCLLIVPSASS